MTGKPTRSVFSNTSGIKDADRVAVFLTVISGILYKLLRNLTSPDKPADKSYGDLNWQGTPGSKTNCDYRKTFHKRNQKRGELIDHFH